MSDLADLLAMADDFEMDREVINAPGPAEGDQSGSKIVSGNQIFQVAPITTVRGPFQKEPNSSIVMQPPPVEIDGMQFVRVKTDDNWLCQFLSGQGKCKGL